ncbi:MAG: aspartate ammonia-lyase [Blastocatellia bacterium]|nr:aspartate ammonia-lyase [Blastocatellia bacterium]MCS7156319.1 aspartate ammonia-lyase [Blastocatellia bacterium]MDW8169043.1 aspartate ammonia-lyase [Acidobacteriota bacterium]MDW8256403.1 aspartate ammonia-lyase [Acidobacteriota bacterium]
MERIERDSLGERAIPADVYYGIQTVRALENYPISGWRPFPEMIRAMVRIKKCAARVNAELGLVEEPIARAIIMAADEVLAGRFDDQFVVDVFNSGAGVSFHMNVNEVLANRANEILGGRRGEYSFVHPNDHVNRGQSTNDVMPTAMRLAALEVARPLLEHLEELARAFRGKGEEFRDVVKAGRTHLQDAVPVRLGREFHAYGRIVEEHARRLRQALEELRVLGIGGTAVGTGLNAHPAFRFRVIEELKRETGEELSPAEDLMAAMQSMAPFVAVSGAMRGLALDMIKICDDLRLMASGPIAGLAEIELPALQPGSSIMPGKVNPVMPEMMTMVCFQVIGNDTTIALAAAHGEFELNVMMPVIAFDLLLSAKLLTNAVRVFTQKAVVGIRAHAERCRYYAEGSPALVTALAPRLGYERAARVARELLSTRKTIREIVREWGWMSEEELRRALDVEAMAEGGPVGAESEPSSGA